MEMGFRPSISGEYRRALFQERSNALAMIDRMADSTLNDAFPRELVCKIRFECYVGANVVSGDLLLLRVSGSDFSFCQ
jgi:hypothetical protein